MTHVDVPAWAAPWVAGPRVEVLGMHDGHPHVVAGVAPDRRRVVVKRVPARRGAHAVRVMRAVARALGDDAALCVPVVRHWHPRPGVVVQDAAEGTVLLQGLGTRRRRSLLVRAAEALATLHACDASVQPVTSMRDHVVDLIHPHPRALAAAEPALASRVRALVRTLVACAPPAGTPVVPIHRDAHARQMIVDGPRLTLVDWDLAAAGDASLDVANFAMYLRTHLAAGDRAAATFLDAYARRARDVTPGLGAATALTGLRLAVKAWRLGRPGWRRRCEQRLADAERALS